MITAIAIILIAFAIALLVFYFYQDYLNRKAVERINQAYLDAARKKRDEEDEEELLELISDLEIESEQIVQYHGTLQ